MKATARLVAATFCLLAFSQAWAKDIVVAQVAALTGAQALSGKAIRAGIKLYIDKVNREGGIDGNRIRFVSYDDGYKADETVRLVKEIGARESPIAFVGILGTANNEALIKDGVLARTHVPLVGAISGASSMVGAPYVFVTKASYRDEVRRLFDILSLIGNTRVAVLYQNDGFGKDILSGAEQAAPSLGIKLVAKAPYERNTTKVDAAVNEVLKADPQVVYLGAVTSAAVEFIKQYRQRGGTAQIYGVSVIDVAGLQRSLSNELLEGYGLGVLWPLTTTRSVALIREYQKLATAAKDPDLAERSMEGYIAAKVLVRGLRQAHSSPASLAKVLSAMNDVDLGDFYLDFTHKDRTGSQFVDFAILDKAGKIHH